MVRVMPVVGAAWKRRAAQREGLRQPGLARNMKAVRASLPG